MSEEEQQARDERIYMTTSALTKLRIVQSILTGPFGHDALAKATVDRIIDMLARQIVRLEREIEHL